MINTISTDDLLYCSHMKYILVYIQETYAKSKLSEQGKIHKNLFELMVLDNYRTYKHYWNSMFYRMTYYSVKLKKKKVLIGIILKVHNWGAPAVMSCPLTCIYTRKFMNNYMQYTYNV